MELDSAMERVIKYLKSVSTNYVLGKEKGKSSEEYTHYQIYIYGVEIDICRIRKKLKRMLKEYFKKNEHLQREGKEVWIKVKKWKPYKNDNNPDSKFGLGYCLKECGLNRHDFVHTQVAEATEYYEKHRKVEQKDCKECAKLEKENKLHDLIFNIDDDFCGNWSAYHHVRIGHMRCKSHKEKKKPDFKWLQIKAECL